MTTRPNGLGLQFVCQCRAHQIASKLSVDRQYSIQCKLCGPVGQFAGFAGKFKRGFCIRPRYGGQFCHVTGVNRPGQPRRAVEFPRSRNAQLLRDDVPHSWVDKRHNRVKF